MSPEYDGNQASWSGPALAAASNASLRLGRAAASTSSATRRVGVAMIGVSVLALGLALLVLPGPSVLVIPLGLTILAKEFRWARWLLQPVRKLLQRSQARARSVLSKGLARHG